MKKILSALLFCIINSVLFGQAFQGKIAYTVKYQPKDSLIMKKNGSLEELYIKNGDYLIKTNGTDIEWKLYKHQTNLIYIKHKNRDTLYTIDASLNKDSIKETEHYKNITRKVNNLEYSEYIFFTTSGMQYFYYSKKIKMDYELFKKHKYNFLSHFLQKAPYVPLIFVNSVADDWFEKEAVSLEELVLDDKLFSIPAGSIIKK